MRVVRVWMPAISHTGLTRRLFLYVTFAISALMPIPFVGKADVIWAANSNVFSSFPAFIYSIIKQAPIVRNVDDLWPEAAIEEGYISNRLSAKIGRLLAKTAYKLCRCLTPISNTYRREIAHHYGIPLGKIHVVEVGVDTGIFHPVVSPAPMTGEGGDKDFTVLYSGILGTGYNFDLLLQAARLLSNEEDIQFIIRGFGEREHEIRKKIAKKGLNNVILSTEFVPLERLVSILSSAGLLILPMMPLEAHEAGIPTKLFEYMACGKPVICCSEGEAAELVRKANCGIVVSPRDPKEVAKAILALRDNRALREEMGRNGYDYVVKHLSIDQIAKKLERVFQSVVG